MGRIIDRTIDYIRTWIDPDKPEEEVPDLDSKVIFPRTVYDAIHKTKEDESTTLTEDLDSIKSSIKEKQDKLPAGIAGKLMTYTGEDGTVGATEVVKVINPDDTERSHSKVVSERAVGTALDGKANLSNVNNHINNADIHVTAEEKEAWNAMAGDGAFQEHIENDDIHVTAEEKEVWDAKPTGTEFSNHVNAVNNPHNVSAHQVGSYTIAEIDDMFESLRESFFNYRNISYDDRTGVATLVEYKETNWNPNYVLSYGTDLPTPADDTLMYFAIRPVTDFSTNESNEAIIYIKEPGLSWREAGLVEMEAGDMVIRYSDAAMCVWIGGRFSTIYTSSSPDEPGGGGDSTLMWRPVVTSEGVLSFVRSSEINPPDPVNIKGPAGYTPQKGIDYNDGANGVGVPEGGDDGEIIVKVSGADFDTEWVTFAELLDRFVDPADIPQLLTDYNNLTNAPKVYNHLGENEDGVITQKAITLQFYSVERAIEQINNIIGGSGGTEGISERLANHLLDYQNPHRVTASQIGAVPNATFLQHTSNTNNPHRVTAEQLGLGAVNNTSDMDKPVSIAQQAAFDEVNRQIAAIYESIGGDDRITTVQWDPNTLTLTFYKVNSEPQEVVIPLIAILNGMSWDEDDKAIVFPLPDGTSKKVPITNLVTNYEGGDTTNTTTDVSDEGIITVTIKSNSVTGNELVKDINLRGEPTTTTAGADDNSTKIATTAYVKKQIVDNLTSDSSDKALSAKMGKYLMQNKATIQDIIDIIQDTPLMNVIDNLTSEDAGAALSANMGRQLNLIKADKVHTSQSGATYGRASVNLFGHARATNVDPLMDGTAEVGTDDGYFARGDHRHPTDLSRAPINWPSGSQFRMTGEFRAETPPQDSNDDRVATTEWVLASGLVPSKVMIQAHMNDHQNPHNVTAAQIGLGNVNNTSDENKPLSAAARAAFEEVNGSIQDLYDTKADKTTVNELSGRIEEVNSTLDGKIDSVEANAATKTALADVEDRVTTLENESATAEDLETLKERVINVENNTASLSSVNNLTARVTTLETSSATKEEVQLLDNKVDGQVEALNTRISELTNIDNMKNEIEEDVTDSIIDIILNSITMVGTDAVFNLAGESMSLHYNETMGTPDIEVDSNGNLILNSTDQAIDTELEKYSFAIEGYDLVVTKEES